MKKFLNNCTKYLFATAFVLAVTFLLMSTYVSGQELLENGGNGPQAPASEPGGSLTPGGPPAGSGGPVTGRQETETPGAMGFFDVNSVSRDGRTTTFSTETFAFGGYVGFGARSISRSDTAIVDLGEGNFFDIVSGPGSGSTWCSISASPRSGNSPLGVNFSLSYGTSPEDCSAPTVSWSAPCNPTTGCSYTFSSNGTYGPYSASVQYFREGGAESVCSPNYGTQVSCSSPTIVVGGGPSPSPQASPTPTPRISPSPTPTPGPGTGGAGTGGGSQSLPPPIMTFIANPTSLPRGGASTLTWTSQNTTSCTAYCISGPCVEWGNPPFTLPFVNKPTSGSQKVTPPNTSTYRLNCFGAGGSVFEDTTVNVGVVKWREITPIF